MEEKPVSAPEPGAPNIAPPPPAPPGPYSTQQPPKEKVPFARQAARFAFWAPLVGLLFGLFINVGLQSSAGSVAPPFGQVSTLVAPILNVSLDVASILLGIVALLGIRKHGTRGILVRSIVGILISGGMLALVAGAIYVVGSLQTKTEHRLMGTWQASELLPTGEPATVTLTLNPDHHGNLKLETRANLLSVPGQWRVATGPLRLLFKFDPNQYQNIGNGAAWRIESLSDAQATLEDNGSGQVTEAVFNRLPAP